MKKRLDTVMVQRGLAPTRSQAQALILAGQVRGPQGEVWDKAGRPVPEDVKVEVLQPPRFVSRGGEKLQGFLDAWGWSPEGLDVLDIGASTGGFTDCVLQAGAASVTAVDVGYGQLHPKLRDDPRVHVRERLNARHLKPSDLPLSAYDWIVMDVSFISVTKLLPVVWSFLKPAGRALVLIKPQFEADKADVDQGRGVIRDPALRQKIVESIQAFCQKTLPNCSVTDALPAPIQGPKGNQEFVLGLFKA